MLLKLQKPCAKPAGIKSELFLLADNIIEKHFPKVFDLTLQSTTTSKILPEKTVINFA